MDRVFITDLAARGIIGLNDWEREKPQEIMINIVLFADLNKPGYSDNINDSVNYRTVAKKALAHVETVQLQTVEAWQRTLRAYVFKRRVCRESVYE